MAGAPSPNFSGLTDEQARERLRSHGPNLPGTPARRGVLAEFLGRFGNPLVAMLLFAVAVSALTGDAAGAAVIAVIVLASVTLDFFQEHRAHTAAQHLAERVAIRVRVMRGAEVRTVPQSDIVPGDLVLLAAGNLVPADGVLVEAHDLLVNQARLTGESYPVAKRACAEIDAGAHRLPEHEHALFMGSSVVGGSGAMLVLATGGDTALGGVAVALESATPATVFERGTRHFGLMLMRVSVAMVLLVLLANLAMHRPLLESFLFSVALAVGLTPELMPMIVSVTLARGALRMARQGVIVKRLSAIQDLGAMDVLCLDKTGTLTEATIHLDRCIDPEANPSRSVLELAWLNSHFASGLRSPLDDAILERGDVDPTGWRKLDELPFDFERRFVSVLVERGETRRLIVKGAPEQVLARCDAVQHNDASRPMRGPERERARDLFDELGRQGLRVLAIAWRPAAGPALPPNDDTGLIFAGFAAFADPPKPSAAEALASLRASGVALKIVTGDTEAVTRHLCDRLGLPVEGVLGGSEIEAMTEDALRARAERTTLFCRTTPAHKHRILLALKARGHAVGFVGDGINDAPSLHAADVGISVDDAVDVAKQAASLVLLRSDLRVLHSGIVEGRRTFANVMKYIMMATSSNFGNMFSMSIATIALPFLPMLPRQILLNNLLYDISELALPLDDVDRVDLRRPRHWDMGFIRRFMFAIGPVSSLFDLLTFAVLLRLFHADAALFQTGWFVESVTTQVLVIFVIRTRGSPLRSRPHALLAAACVAVVAIAALLPYSRIAPVVGLVRLPPAYFGVLLVLSAAYLLLVDRVKRSFLRRAARRRRP